MSFAYRKCRCRQSRLAEILRVSVCHGWVVPAAGFDVRFEAEPRARRV